MQAESENMKVRHFEARRNLRLANERMLIGSPQVANASRRSQGTKGMEFIRVERKRKEAQGNEGGN